MNKKTKLYIGIVLVISAFTTLFTFISLCFKKKSALAALAALAAAEGLVGLALIEDNTARKKTAAQIDAEIFGEDGIDLSEVATDSDEALDDADAKIDFDIPKDEEASEEDFI